jgi:translation initiation factor 2 alpha subunit (eIF-2alpha)
MIPKPIFLCKVIKINPTFILLEFDNKIGICHISEVSDYRVENIQEIFKINESYYFLLLKNDDLKKKYYFSYKRIRPKLLRSHRAIIPTISGYKNLYDYTLKLLG